MRAFINNFKCVDISPRMRTIAHCLGLVLVESNNKRSPTIVRNE